MTKVLVVGESWVKHTIHMKGFDQFHSTEYEEGGGAFLDALEASGYDVAYVRAHEISSRFPATREALNAYDVIIISDVGANSFLLTDEVFLRSERSVNRLELIADFVREGGGLVMVGGYLSFSGIDARARYGRSPLAPILPVEILDVDDRVEKPEGVEPHVTQPGHEVLNGTPVDWPALLGYNQLTAKPGAEVVATCGGDPLLVVDSAGAGRVVAFASDFAPHWAPPEFVGWEHYRPLWAAVTAWAAGQAAGATDTHDSEMRVPL